MRRSKQVTKKIFFGIAVTTILFIVFIEFAINLNYSKLLQFDQNISAMIYSYNNPWLTMLMKGFTFIGSVDVVIVIAIMIQYYLLRRLRDYWKSFFSLIALLGAWLSNEYLKEAFHRLRPDLHRLIEISGYSFPSGHAMVSSAFYGMLAYLIYVNNDKKFFKYVLPLLLIVIIFFIGLSRVYLGVHYPSDVLAGFAGGSIWLVVCIISAEAIKDRHA